MSDKDDFLNKVQSWKTQSESLMDYYQHRWAKNLRLINGVYSENTSTKSKVTGKSKIFYRKTWATIQRLVASFHSAFLKDQDNFRIEGRDTYNDAAKARILHKMTEYRRDVLMRTKSLFLQFIWGFKNIADLGSCFGKLSWKYNAETGEDEPDFILYPNEQVFLDMTAETKERMKFVIFENYLTKEDMEEMGYENIDKAQSVSIPNSQLRNARYYKTTDPLQNPGENEYPKPGRYEDDRKDELGSNRYRVWEVFHKEKGKIKFTVTNQNKVILKKTEDSRYGDRYPIIIGQCLTEAHKLLGEGFPEPLEGPQESINATLNQRKDSVTLAMNKMFMVSKYGGVDVQSLAQQRPGGIVKMNEIGAVQEIQHSDVTQSAYVEASQDEQMMDEMSGIVDIKRGMGGNTKATVAQINLSESNAKIDFYVAVVAETFIREFYSLLAYMIQRFETDEKVFRIANESFRREEGLIGDDIYDIDFEADCIINVGLGTVGRGTEIQQTLLAMDRAIMANQAIVQLMQVPGAVPEEGIKIVNTSALLEDLFEKIGKKDTKRYFIQLGQPTGEPGGQNPALAGENQPQIGGREASPDASALQYGGLGGL
jgi:hypothetical protein